MRRNFVTQENSEFEEQNQDLMQEALERAMYGNRKSAKNFIQKLQRNGSGSPLKVSPVKRPLPSDERKDVDFSNQYIVKRPKSAGKPKYQPQ